MSPAHGKARILLVDGDATVQHLRALMLRMKGHRVEMAASLEQAHARLAKSGYDLVIVDVGHYAEPGFQFCEEVKKKHPRQKILMQAEDRVFPARNECPDNVIPKQEGPQVFVREVERLLQAA